VDGAPWLKVRGRQKEVKVEKEKEKGAKEKKKKKKKKKKKLEKGTKMTRKNLSLPFDGWGIGDFDGVRFGFAGPFEENLKKKKERERKRKRKESEKK